MSKIIVKPMTMSDQITNEVKKLVKAEYNLDMSMDQYNKLRNVILGLLINGD